MPLVTKKISSEMSKGGWRPHCCICGRYIGVGGLYDVGYDYYNGGYEEGYSTCKFHTNTETETNKEGK